MNRGITFNLPGIPLCGWEWLHQHRNDYTQAQIDALGIEVTCAGHRYPTITGEQTRGTVKKLVKANR